ncbi:hypothetical protein H8356DRAFT_1674862 [Neocallimastix lanati (nom. inval.)]|jgi:hypothetical protein|uniref:Uncharacterized protein n=1 Tax=Neocallimastix californiae TaxID=1754190 RepID=A0A1Y2E5E3_9FUNG|nr:hypothetical protein H8356DRAFT_1674862 [Neocallimastix sp. JGI-2020a]ORY66749.1 hypothetical protein LY90DRAFT_667914 [Neocallimastix californiae]|eukprot:ORY66749.1 hypothetical protein LY90DRAFT_667914 [Neocallimastix californiae]
MVKIQTSALLKTTLFWLNCNFVFGQNPFMNSGSATENNININKSECQTIMDCSLGALECRKDIMNESISHCIYPDNLNEVSFNNIKIPVNNTENELLNLGNTTITTNTTTIECTKNEECTSNKCVSGQCQIELNPFFINSTVLNDDIISNNNTISLNCTTNEECPSHSCVSGQCQTNLEHAVLDICNTDQADSICGNKLEGEKCKKDSECMTSFCDQTTNVCKKKSNNNNNNNKMSPAASIIIITTGVCVGFVLVVLLIKKDRAERAKKVKEQYMENVHEPMYIIYSDDYDVPTYTY